MTATTGSSLVVVDSSGWVEYWGNGPKAAVFDPYFDHEDRLILPTIALYEVFKKLLTTRGSNLANRFLSFAYRTRIVPLDHFLAVAAAEHSIRHKLAMADAIIYATTLSCQAELITSDQAFQGLPGVTLL